MAQNKSQGTGSGTSNRGFASMDEAKQREIASKGGRSVAAQDRSFSQDRELAAQAGRKGGQASHGGRGAQRRGTASASIPRKAEPAASESGPAASSGSGAETHAGTHAGTHPGTESDHSTNMDDDADEVQGSEH